MAKKTPIQDQRAAERQNYQKLERRLVLLAWLQGKFGFSENRELLEDLEGAGEGYDDEGRSHVAGRLLSRGDKCRVPRAELERYDANIRGHLAHINRLRTRPVVLRYFQQLALLFAEVYLDAFFGRPASLLDELNRFVDGRNIDKLPGDPPDSRFTGDELRKLAYWMATGSGKTLLFHLNYLQFLSYARRAGVEIDNILLITPNENLSAQHLEEMAESDIPCARFSLEESGLRSSRPDTVRVLEITKLVTEKKGSGVSVPVEAFEGSYNLIFVDEGHKGTGSDAETWRGRRQALAELGFTFEYSATFGQALDASKKDVVTEEYAKSILFDYSYKYFYGDGYGKDFHILNLKDYAETEDVHTLLLANLLSFYEQRKFHHEKANDIREYLLEPPLWLQICSRVSAKNAEVVTVLEFLARFVVNARGWAVRKIAAILEGRSGIELEDGQDLFKGRLPYLRRGNKTPDAEKVFHGVLSKVFQAASPGELEVRTIKAASGEVGLRVSGTETYFGLLYIGDVNAFKKIVEKEAPGIAIAEDAIAKPIFPTVKDPRSKVNLLIGAKKFMEGWSSWRVSNIGLLNVGVSEGSEIIQLFGRGVRLKGLGFNLRRSSALAGLDHPPHLRLLETLNIFAVRANYMTRFRDYLEREGVDTGGYVEMDLPLWTNKPFLDKNLYRPRLPDNRKFLEESSVLLEPDPAVKARLDVTTRVNALQSAASGGIHEAEASAGHATMLTKPILGLLDWQAIHLDLVNYKEARGYGNLTVPVGAARRIMESVDPACYELRAPDDWVGPKNAGHFGRLQETVTSVLRKYLDQFYKHARQRWESNHMVYDTLTVQDENFQPYRVSVPRSDPALVATILEIIGEARKLSGKAKPEKLHAGYHEGDLPNIHFDRHLFQPLLVAGNKSALKTSPPGLNEGEKRFVEDLRSFCHQEAEGFLKGKELFLLRNLGKGKGIGFFDARGFYPDFIIWLKQGAKQRILFVEPHGMLLEAGGVNSDKVNLHQKLREYSKTALKKGRLGKLELDAAVVSVTPYDALSQQQRHDDGRPYSREEFAAVRVFFQENREGDYDYVRALLR